MGNAIRKFQMGLLAGKKMSQRDMNLWDMWEWEGSLQRVYICAPFEGRNTRSQEKIWWYCHFAKDHNCIPVAPYLYFPEFMNEMIEKERKQMEHFALCNMQQAQEVWVFGDVMTPAMKRELELANDLGINIRFLPDWDIIRDYWLEEADKHE